MARYSERKRGGTEAPRKKERMDGEIKCLAKTRIRVLSSDKKAPQIDVLAPEDMGARTIFLLSVPSLIIVKEPGRRRRFHSK